MPLAGETIRTPEIDDKLAHAIRLGLSKRIAAMYAGISLQTLDTWLSESPDLLEQLNAAEAEGHCHHAGQLWDPDKESGPKVTASKFFLATRRNGEAWVQQTKVEGTGSVAVSLAHLMAPGMVDGTASDEAPDLEAGE